MVAAALALASAGWVVSVQQMQGMDMGAATSLGSFPFFVGLWVAMMTAMMLPGALPALAAPQFAAAYLAVWTIAGLAVYVLYFPHGTIVAGILTVAAGVYELTPLKQACRRRCRENVRSGSQFGLYCIGSSIGLMVVLLAVGAMNVTWMIVIATLVVAQKLLPPRALLDRPLALALVGLGIAIAAAPSAIPGIT